MAKNYIESSSNNSAYTFNVKKLVLNGLSNNNLNGKVPNDTSKMATLKAPSSCGNPDGRLTEEWVRRSLSANSSKVVRPNELKIR